MSKETPHICTTVKLLKPAIFGNVPKIHCLPQQGKHLGGSKPSRNKWRCLDFVLQTLLSIIVPWERAPVTPKQSSLQRYSEGSRWSQSLRSWDEFPYSCRQVFIYFFPGHTDRQACRYFRAPSPRVSPQHPPRVAVPPLVPRLGGKAARAGQAAPSQSSRHVSPRRRWCEGGQLAAFHGDHARRFHRAQAPPAADVGFYCSGLPYHWATCTTYLTYSSYSVAGCTEIILAGYGS